MTDLRKDFKNWLINIQNYKERTADIYIRQTVVAYKKNFNKKHFYLNKNDWSVLSENLLPLLVKYYELSNKEYFVDRVTILHALDYLYKVTQFINSSKALRQENKTTVKLYLYCYEGDFYIDSVNFENIQDYVQLFNSFCYRRESKTEYLDSKDIQEFLSKLSKVIKINNIEDSSVYDSALHIIYDSKDVGREKTALSHCCSFLYASTGNVLYDYKNNEMIVFAKTSSPKKKIKHYDVVNEITGEKPMQICCKYDIECKIENSEYCLTLRELAEIFNVSQTSGIILLDQYKDFHPEITILSKYYSILATNKCLQEYYYPIKKKHSGVNYKLKGGYKNWIKRNKALSKLNIGRDAFYTQIWGGKKMTQQCLESCSHIEYAKNAPQYYIRDIEFLANTLRIQSISNRKNGKKQRIS